MTQYEDLIPQNVALPGTRRIGIYNSGGNRVGQIRLDTLTPPTEELRQYSFGALSDVHIVYTTAADDFKKALTYLNESEAVAFTCVCGDLTDSGTACSVQGHCGQPLAGHTGVCDCGKPRSIRRNARDGRKNPALHRAAALLLLHPRR